VESKNAARTSIRISGNRYRQVFECSYFFSESDPYKICGFEFWVRRPKRLALVSATAVCFRGGGGGVAAPARGGGSSGGGDSGGCVFITAEPMIKLCAGGEGDRSTSDIGYAQAVLDDVDKLSVAVNEEMQTQGITGIMIFPIKNSAYHSSFTDRLTTVQQSACAVANIDTSECSKDAQSVTNPNYVYRRRLLSVGYAEIEGLFISDDSSVFADSSKREEHLTMLRLALVSAVVEHASLLSDTDGNAFVLSVDNIDFQEIVAFTLPQKEDQEDQNKTVDDDEFQNPVEENAEENNALLIGLRVRLVIDSKISR